MNIQILCYLIALLFATPAWADVYKWKGSDGKVHYSDTLPVAGESQDKGIQPSDGGMAQEAEKYLADQGAEEGGNMPGKQVVFKLHDASTGFAASAAKPVPGDVAVAVQDKLAHTGQ